MTEERLKELWNSSAERQELIAEVRRLRAEVQIQTEVNNSLNSVINFLRAENELLRPHLLECGKVLTIAEKRGKEIQSLRELLREAHAKFQEHLNGCFVLRCQECSPFARLIERIDAALGEKV